MFVPYAKEKLEITILTLNIWMDMSEQTLFNQGLHGLPFCHNTYRSLGTQMDVQILGEVWYRFRVSQYSGYKYGMIDIELHHGKPAKHSK